MKDILRQAKFKGDKHVDKPVSEFKARGKTPTWGKLTAMEAVHEPVQPFGGPEFAKNRHTHGPVPNKINYKGF